MRTTEVRWESAGHAWTICNTGDNIEIVRNADVLALTREECGELASELRGLVSIKERVGPERAGQPWTEGDDEVLSARWLKGETIAAIAAELQRSRGAIKARLILNELTTRDDLAR